MAAMSRDFLTLVQFQYDPRAIPLGALYLSTGLDEAAVPFELKVYPAYTDAIDLQRLESFFAQSGRVLAVGCWSDMLPFVLEAVTAVKKSFPDKVVVLGGIGPSEVAEEIIRAFPAVDFIIKGCGVEALPALWRFLQGRGPGPDSVPGLVWRRGKRVISGSRELFYSRERIPVRPSYRLIPGSGECTVFNLRTSSGCPYRCTYCLPSVLSGSRVFKRPLPEVGDELAEISAVAGTRDIVVELVDEGFIVDRARVLAFCRMLRRRRLRLRWHCYGRVDRVDAQLLERMAEAGCASVFFGVESGSDRVLRLVGKGFTSAQAAETVLMAARHVPEVIASFMCFFPFETVEDFRKTLELKRVFDENGITTHFSPLAPVKGSPLFRRYRGLLRFSSRIPAAFHKRIELMPPRCLRLVRRYPEVFYFYYYYHGAALHRLLKLARLWDLSSVLSDGGSRKEEERP